MWGLNNLIIFSTLSLSLSRIRFVVVVDLNGLWNYECVMESEATLQSLFSMLYNLFGWMQANQVEFDQE